MLKSNQTYITMYVKTKKNRNYYTFVKITQHLELSKKKKSTHACFTDFSCMLKVYFTQKKKGSKKSTFYNGFYFWYFIGKSYVATIDPLLEACSVLMNILKPIPRSLFLIELTYQEHQINPNLLTPNTRQGPTTKRLLSPLLREVPINK